MGLDMYLTAERYVYDSDDESSPESQAIESLREAFPEMSPFRPQAIIFEIAYWRKANAIHRWFVENVQNGVDDCASYYVAEDQLRGLYDLTCALLKDRDEELALKLLPPMEGFFFGNTVVDDFYWLDVETTKERLEKMEKVLMLASLRGPPTHWAFKYRASW